VKGGREVTSLFNILPERAEIATATMSSAASSLPYTSIRESLLSGQELPGANCCHESLAPAPRTSVLPRSVKSETLQYHIYLLFEHKKHRPLDPLTTYHLDKGYEF